MMAMKLTIGRGAPSLPLPSAAETVQDYIESHVDLARRMTKPFPTTDADGKRRWYQFRMPQDSTLEIQRGLTAALEAAAAQGERDGAEEVAIPIPDEWSFIIRVTRGIKQLEREWEKESTDQEGLKPKRRPPTLPPLAVDGYLRTRSDRICKATVEALAPGAIRTLSAEEWKRHGILPGENWHKGYPFRTGKKDQVAGVVGFTREPTPVVWDTLQKNGPLAVKAQYALMARAYEQTDAAPGQFLTISIPQFCDDIGYKRHKGGHRPERKREAMKVLELMTSLEVSASYITPKGKNKRLRGPLWIRGHIAEQYDGYADLFGTNRAGDPEMWEPVAFSYAPSSFFGEPEWRKYNSRVAKVGRGLMELRTDTDQWAIMVGGYLGTVTRMNGYRESVLKVQTLIERTGLKRADAKHPGRALDKLETALDKVQEVGIIARWEYTDISPEEPDMDDTDDLEKLVHAVDNRETKRVRIIWPEDLPEIKPGPKAIRSGKQHPPTVGSNSA